jgi:YbbR domain-containing protein
LAPGEVVAVLELGGAGPGRRLFQLTPENIRVPFGLDVTQVVPASVAIEFEQSATRRVPIAPAVQGEPAPGFVVGTITAEPKEVEITGPATAVSLATEALTEAVSVSGARDTVVRSVNVGLLSPLLRVKSSRASVRVQIVPGPSERVLRDQPVRLRGVGERLAARAIPPAVVVVLRGTREAVGNTGTAGVTAFVDLAGLGVGDYRVPVRVESPPKVGAMRVEPIEVRVEIHSVKN